MMYGKARAEKTKINTDFYTEQEKFDAFARWAEGLEAFCFTDGLQATDSGDASLFGSGGRRKNQANNESG